jgi:hypothetical protein
VGRNLPSSSSPSRRGCTFSILTLSQVSGAFAGYVPPLVFVHRRVRSSLSKACAHPLIETIARTTAKVWDVHVVTLDHETRYLQDVLQGVTSSRDPSRSARCWLLISTTQAISFLGVRLHRRQWRRGYGGGGQSRSEFLRVRAGACCGNTPKTPTLKAHASACDAQNPRRQNRVRSAARCACEVEGDAGEEVEPAAPRLLDFDPVQYRRSTHTMTTPPFAQSCHAFCCLSWTPTWNRTPEVVRKQEETL